GIGRSGALDRAPAEDISGFGGEGFSTTRASQSCVRANPQRGELFADSLTRRRSSTPSRQGRRSLADDRIGSRRSSRSSSYMAFRPRSRAACREGVMKFASKLINFDACPQDPFRPLATPIYQTATFDQEEADRFGRYDYSRSGNPTRTVLEDLLADLENATHGFCFASGMAATSTVTRLLRSGDEMLAGDDLYGGSCRLFSKVLDRTGIGVRYADACDPEHFAKQFTAKTRLVFIETPTNPLARIADIRALARVAHERGALLCVDNSAMSPYLQNPLDL